MSSIGLKRNRRLSSSSDDEMSDVGDLESQNNSSGRPRIRHASDEEDVNLEDRSSTNNSDDELIDGLCALDQSNNASHPGQSTENLETISNAIMNEIEPSENSCSSADCLLGGNQHEESTGMPQYLKQGFDKVHCTLQNKGVYKFELPTTIVPDKYDLLTISSQYESTMDSVAKKLRLVPQRDQSRYCQPYEGYSLFYMDRCNSANLSQHAFSVLYFYSELQNLIMTNGLTNYAIPMPSQNLKRNKKRENNVIGLSETVLGNGNCEHPTCEANDGLVSIVHALQERESQMNLEHKIDRLPFTIRVAFTGALYEISDDHSSLLQDSSQAEGKEQRKELFCFVIITPNLAFDLHSYIKDLFFSPPKNALVKEHWAELHFWYKNIQMYEVNHNCGLPCDPFIYDNDVGGKAGVFSVLGMLNLPYRVLHVLKEEHKTLGGSIDNLKIIGFPDLSYKNDGTMEMYHKYLHRFINYQADFHEKFLHNCKVFYSSSDVEQKEDLVFDMPCPGGWPYRFQPDNHGEITFTDFGLFKFPILMNFVSEGGSEKMMTRESFLINFGSLPLSVEKKNRDFKTFDLKSDSSSLMPDEKLLKSTDLATPLNIITKYYGPNARPADDFMDHVFVKYFAATKMHIEGMVEDGVMDAEKAVVHIETHMYSCMEQHRCILENDGYGSHHLEQCRKITRDLHQTKLHSISLKGVFDYEMAHVVPDSIVHDPYLTSSFILMHQWYVFNQDARLNATNAETALEIMLSSLAWIIDSHHFSIVPFFQGMVIMGNRGHNKVLIDKLFWDDQRKPNSSGAGCIQDRLNKYLEELGICFNIMKGRDNKIVFVNPNRSTEVALEQESCVVTVTTGGIPEVQSRPSPAFKFMPLLMLELRGNPLDNIIKLVFPRDAAARNIIATTVDPKNTNERKVAIKEQVVNPNVCALCTNVKKASEEGKTIACVTHAALPGAPAYRKLEEQSGVLNDVKCELNDGRATMPSGDKLLIILKTIFFSQIFAKVEVGMLHKAGAFPYSINFVTSATLDWFYMLVREHLFCLFNSNMIENFGRIRVLLN